MIVQGSNLWVSKCRKRQTFAEVWVSLNNTLKEQ